MRTRLDLYTADQRSDTLLVLLPPALSSIEDLDNQGFVAAVHQRQLPIDILLADATTQHVIDHSVIATLHTEVVQPARAQCYRTIWLAGISIGAFSALHYAAQHADHITGLYLIAPYPGTADVLTEIRAAGGVSTWCQNPPHIQDERAWWQWLGREALKGEWHTPVYFGTGSADRFLSGQRLLSEVLPEDRVHVHPGTHQWPTWKALWDDWLDHGPLTCKASASTPLLPELQPTGDTYNT